jgi:hypothetical protein
MYKLSLNTILILFQNVILEINHFIELGFLFSTYGLITLFTDFDTQRNGTQTQLVLLGLTFRTRSSVEFKRDRRAFSNQYKPLKTTKS